MRTGSSRLLIVAALLLLWVTAASADEDLDALLERECRPLGVRPEIAKGITWVESNGHALALGVQVQGQHRSVYPEREPDARAWLDLFLGATDNVGIGLMPINWRAWGDKLGIEPADLFDPTLNVRTGCRILRDALKRHGVDRGIGVYHSPAPARQRGYQAKVSRAIMRRMR